MPSFPLEPELCAATHLLLAGCLRHVLVLGSKALAGEIRQHHGLWAPGMQGTSQRHTSLPFQVVTHRILLLQVQPDGHESPKHSQVAAR